MFPSSRVNRSADLDDAMSDDSLMVDFVDVKELVDDFPQQLEPSDSSRPRVVVFLFELYVCSALGAR